MAIETLLFDLGKVLIDFNLHPMLDQFAANSTRPAAELEELMRDSALLHRFESGGMSTDEYYEHVCEAAALTMDKAAFWHAVESIFAPGLLVSEELLRALAARYPLILVSNTNEIHARYVQDNYRVFDYFTHKVLSYEVRSMKPDSVIYQKAIEVSGKSAEQLFFTDDRPENIAAARRFGIHAHQFHSEAVLIEALQAAGVDVSFQLS